MRQSLVAGNWKMNGSRASAKELVEGIKAGIAGTVKTQIALCPPHAYLADVAAMLQGTSMALGAQNLCYASSGAYTGEISATMLLDFGCTCYRRPLGAAGAVWRRQQNRGAQVSRGKQVWTHADFLCRRDA